MKKLLLAAVLLAAPVFLSGCITLAGDVASHELKNAHD